MKKFKKIVCVLLVILMFADVMYSNQEICLAKIYEEEEAFPILDKCICLYMAESVKMNKGITKMTIVQDGKKSTYKISKNIKEYEQLGSFPVILKEKKSSRKKFKKWITNNPYPEFVCVVIKNKTIVGYGAFA